MSGAERREPIPEPVIDLDPRKSHRIRYQTAFVIVYCCGKNERLNERKYRVARGMDPVTCRQCLRRGR